MTWNKPFIPPPSIKLCQCVHFDAIKCLTERYREKDTHFARCMGGCSCKCHRDKQGADINRGVWNERRQKLIEILENRASMEVRP